MADGFDSEEIIYEMIKTCGVPVFKGPSPRDQEGNHVVVRSVVCNNIEVVNVAQVAVNIFVDKPDNGVIDRSSIKSLLTAIETLIKNASDPAGYYCVIDKIFSKTLESAKRGFDCFTIRYELTLNT